MLAPMAVPVVFTELLRDPGLGWKVLIVTGGRWNARLKYTLAIRLEHIIERELS